MKWPFMALILAAGIALGFYFYREKVVETASNKELVIYGNVDIRQVQLAFQEQGRIQKLYAEEGDRVKKGQLLAELDNSRYLATVQTLEAKVSAQEQVVAKLHAGTRPEEKEAARARVERAKALLEDAILTYKRLKALSKNKYVSRQKLDNAKAQVDASRALLNEAEQMYRLALKGPRKEDIAKAEATLRALRSELSLAQIRLKDTKLFSPSDGIIRDRILEPGDMAFPNRPVFTLALMNPLWIRAYVPETELGKIAPGMEAEVFVDSFPDEAFRGWIGYISPTAEFTPRNVETPELRTRLVYQVRVFVCDHKNKLRLGMPATVKIKSQVADSSMGTLKDCKSLKDSK